MRKTVFIYPAIALAMFITVRSSCSNRELIPFLGKWSGGFDVESIQSGPDTTKDRKRSSLQGFIMVYATGRSFKMHLEGEQEVIDTAGKWVLHGQRLTLRTTEVKIDDQGGSDVRDPNKKFIPPEDVKATYARPLSLDLSSDKHRYIGLTVGMGNLVGRHQFLKDSY